MSLGPVRLGAAMVGLLVATVSGCGLFGGPDPGPIGKRAAEEVSESCLPAKDDGQYAMGFEVLNNPDTDEAHLTGVSLVGAKDVRMVEAVVVDVVDSTSVGLQYWPPLISGTPQWTARVPHSGAVIPAKTQTKNLVLHLETTGLPASLTGTRVAYEIDGHDYEFETGSALEIKDKCF